MRGYTRVTSAILVDRQLVFYDHNVHVVSLQFSCHITYKVRYLYKLRVSNVPVGSTYLDISFHDRINSSLSTRKLCTKDLYHPSSYNFELH